MITTYLNPDYGEKDNTNQEERCLAKIYLYILEIGLEPETNYKPDEDDSQNEKAEKSFWDMTSILTFHMMMFAI